MKKVLVIILLILALIVATGYYFSVPKITLHGDNPIEVTMKDGYHEPGFEAKLAFKYITAHVVVDSEVNDNKVGSYTVTYTVDYLGKSAETERQVNVVDREPPVISLKEGKSITIRSYSQFNDPGHLAMDDSDGDVTENVQVKGYVDTYNKGKYYISYQVSDSYGNEAKVNREVIVAGEPIKKIEKVIYLTFDDGPSDTVTSRILKTLKKYDVPATFFILDYGQNEEKIKMLKRAINQGCTIGLHGYSHDYGKIYSSTTAFMDNITSLDAKIQKDLGYTPFVIRFPGGSSNTVSRNYEKGIMSQLVKAVQLEGYMHSDWNVDSNDASANSVSAERIVSSVKKECSEDTYNVILMHDSASKETTADALPEIIEWALEEGYTFKAMEKGGPTIHQRVNN